jgi:Bacterial regulatory proteins, luxR family
MAAAIDDQIATALVVSEATVKTHVNRILAKLDLHSRAQAVVLAYESGLIRPGASEGREAIWLFDLQHRHISPKRGQVFVAVGRSRPFARCMLSWFRPPRGRSRSWSV